jgi:hypothetical protein
MRIAMAEEVEKDDGTIVGHSGTKCGKEALEGYADFAVAMILMIINC